MRYRDGVTPLGVRRDYLFPEGPTGREAGGGEVGYSEYLHLTSEGAGREPRRPHGRLAALRAALARRAWSPAREFIKHLGMMIFADTVLRL